MQAVFVDDGGVKRIGSRSLVEVFSREPGGGVTTPSTPRQESLYDEELYPRVRGTKYRFNRPAFLGVCLAIAIPTALVRILVDGWDWRDLYRGSVAFILLSFVTMGRWAWKRR